MPRSLTVFSMLIYGGIIISGCVPAPSATSSNDFQASNPVSPQQLDNKTPNTQKIFQGDSLGAFAGRWSGSGTNSLGYSRTGSLLITPINANTVDVSASVQTSDKSYSYSEKGIVNGNTMNYRLGEANCTDLLLDERTLSHSCEGSGTSIKMIFLREPAANPRVANPDGDYSAKINVGNQNNVSKPRQESKYASQDATACVEVVPKGFKCEGPHDRFLTNICIEKITVRWRVGSDSWGLQELDSKACYPVSYYRDTRPVDFQACSWDPKASYGPFMNPCRY